MPSKLLSNRDCDKVFEVLSDTWPNAECELKYNNDFQLILAVLLSAQTTDVAVNKALAPLFKKKPNFSPADLVKMGESGFLSVIKSIGLAPTKAKNSLRMAAGLIQNHNSVVPNDRGELEKLPGVGRKTASVVLNVLFGHPTIAVDTHVFRVAQRLGVCKVTARREDVEEALLKRVPKKYLLKVHHVLIFHGRYHCVARNPKCPTCPVVGICKQAGVISIGL